MMLPKAYDDILELPKGSVWPWVDSDGRDAYKIYTPDREVARILKKAEGVKIGAAGYPGQIYDFICRSYIIKSVIKILQATELKN